MAHPAKVALPLTAFWGFVVQLRVAPLAGWVAMVRSIDAFERVTTLPPTSSTHTRGWVVKFLASVVPAGSV